MKTRVIEVDRDKPDPAAIEEAAERHNKAPIDKGGIYEGDKQVKPRFIVSKEEPRRDIEEQRLELSERVRKGELFGFLDIGPKVLTAPPRAPSDKGDKDANKEASVRYQSNRPTFVDFSNLAGQVITEQVRAYAAEHGVDDTIALELGMKEKSVEFAAAGGEVYVPPPARR